MALATFCEQQRCQEGDQSQSESLVKKSTRDIVL